MAPAPTSPGVDVFVREPDPTLEQLAAALDCHWTDFYRRRKND